MSRCIKILLAIQCFVSLSAFAGDMPVLANPFAIEPIEPEKMHDNTFVMFFVMLTLFSGWALWKKSLNIGLLVFIAAFFTSWQEFYADWGGYLYWNPGFEQLPWGISAFTTPVKPLFIPFSWAWYFSLILPLMVLLINFLHRKMPKVSTFAWSLLLVGPIFYGYNIMTEKTAGDMAWWGYLEAFGPVAQATYSQYPLLWPALGLAFWAVILVWLMTLRDQGGYWWHERLVGLDRMESGIRQGFARVAAFVLMYNVSCLIFVTLPCVLARILFGVDNLLIP
jgi:hypothetical protein